MRLFAPTSLLVGLTTVSALAAPSAGDIMKKVLESDAYGTSGGEFLARATVKDKQGSTRQLSFTARSRRYKGLLSKALMRFSAPADVKGMSFLQIEKDQDDDERHLYLPELKKSRRVAGNMRGQAFMGTDFSYADLDRRDLRDGKARLLGEEKLSGHAVYHLEVLPSDKNSPYARLELWVRQDNHVPLKQTCFNAAGVLLKTQASQEIQRIKGRWFITKSVMVTHQEGRQTELVLEKASPEVDVPDDEFTVRNLEKT